MVVYDITLIGVMVAVIETSNVALSFLPNIKLTSFWRILFTTSFGAKVVVAESVFALV